VNLKWLGRLAGAAAAIWLMATLLEFANRDNFLREDYVSMGIAVLVYMIGYSGLRQPEVFRYQTSEFAIPVPPPAPVQAPPADPDEPPALRYERSGLDDKEAEQLQGALVALMERERPWSDSELTLPDLATQLGTTPHKLSEVLNSRIGQTFYDFVNGYRVREVQRRIAAGEARRLKMLSLALDAGFASKSTFNEVFKKHTMQTPSGFQKAVGK
jgi:AraC-like DNA-binding protein